MSVAGRAARERWFVDGFRNGNASTSLYCFPYAGGSASYYAGWARHYTGSVELVPVQLPGREARMAEPPPTAVGDVADEVAALIAAVPTRPLLFGHSMGAILAFEVARRLEALARPAGHLFVSGRPAPAITRPRVPISALPRADFLRVLADYGAVAEEVLRHQDLLDLLLPTVRADFAMIESYTCPEGPRLTCPILGWCGVDDPDVTPESMAGWADHTRAGFELRSCPGGHFFVSGQAAGIARAVHRVR